MKKKISEYKNKYEQDKYDRIILLVKKGRKEELKVIAAANNKSLNSFIVGAVEEKINSLKEEETP